MKHSDFTSFPVEKWSPLTHKAGIVTKRERFLTNGTQHTTAHICLLGKLYNNVKTPTLRVLSVQIWHTHSWLFNYIHKTYSFARSRHEGLGQRVSRDTDLGISFTTRPLYYQKLDPSSHSTGRWVDAKIRLELLGQDGLLPCQESSTTLTHPLSSHCTNWDNPPP